MSPCRGVASRLLVIGLVVGPPTMLMAVAARAAEPDCQVDLTCARSAFSVVVPPRSQGPDLSGWRLASLTEPPRDAGSVPVPSDRLTDPTLGLAMVLIPGACYQVPGSPGPETEEPAVICRDPYYLGAHEVTFEAYDRFAQETQRELPEDEAGAGATGR